MWRTFGRRVASGLTSVALGGVKTIGKIGGVVAIGGLICYSFNPRLKKDQNVVLTWDVNSDSRFLNFVDRKHFDKKDQNVVLTWDVNPDSRFLNFVDSLEALSYAKSDPRVLGIVFNLTDARLSWPQAEEVSRALGQSPDKFSFCYSENYLSEANYYVGSQCDKLFIAPGGRINLKAPYFTKYYLKGFLDLIGVQLNVFRRKEFKSLFNHFTDDHMSDSERQMQMSLLKEKYDFFVEGVLKKRKLAFDFEKILQKNVLFSSSEAQAVGLVDSVTQHRPRILSLLQEVGDLTVFEEMLSQVKEKLGLQTLEEASNKVKTMPLIDYARIQTIEKKFTKKKSAFSVEFSVPIVTLDGPINSNSAVITMNLLKKAMQINKSGAIVLRINSPGGIVAPCFLLSKAIEELQIEYKKPIFVSVGEVAASGGYLCASSAAKIYTNSTSVLGSIGVISSWPLLPGLFEKLKIKEEIIQYLPPSSGKQAENVQGFTEMSETIRGNIDHNVGVSYDEFLGEIKARRGPRLKVDLESVAKGRVWTGNVGVELGLADAIGGLEEAKSEAKQHILTELGVKSGDGLQVDINFVRPQKNQMEVLMPLPKQTDWLYHNSENKSLLKRLFKGVDFFLVLEQLLN